MSPSQEPRLSRFDRDELLARVGGDLQLARDVIELFRQDSAVHLAAIRRAVEGGAADELRTAAHTLKGAAGLLSAVRVMDAAHALEVLGRDRALGDAAAALGSLERELNDLLAVLAVN